jgi:hypothetical protein
MENCFLSGRVTEKRAKRLKRPAGWTSANETVAAPNLPPRGYALVPGARWNSPKRNGSFTYRVIDALTSLC